MQNTINYYMSEVEVPPEIEEKIKSLDSYDLSEMIRDLANAISVGYFRPYEKLDYLETVHKWFHEQSRTTWVGVLRWLAMEAI